MIRLPFEILVTGGVAVALGCLCLLFCVESWKRWKTAKALRLSLFRCGGCGAVVSPPPESVEGLMECPSCHALMETDQEAAFRETSSE